MVDIERFYLEMRSKVRRIYGIRSDGLIEDQHRDFETLEPILMDDSDYRNFSSACLCRGCKNEKSTVSRKRLMFEWYDNITRSNRQTLTDQEYFLCPKVIRVFSFNTRTWGEWRVSTLSCSIQG
jgi:hypothetical protein